MYCYEDEFFEEIFDFADNGFPFDDVKDGTVFEFGLCSLEPIIKLDSESLIEVLRDANEERQSEDGDEWEKLENILLKYIQFDSINSEMPQLWFPNGKTVEFTKEELIKIVENETNKNL